MSLGHVITTGCVLLGACQGCATLSNGRGWGQDATLTPGWRRVESAAVKAVLDPETWAPLAGAVLLQVENADTRIADWAADNTPLFGSAGTASRWSDDLLLATESAYWLSVLITPSAVAYADMTPEDIVECRPNGEVVRGKRRPSSELGFHLALYRHREDIGAVVHTHSVFATTLACMHREIPAVHYLVGFAGPKVPLAPYATFGTPALASAIVDTIGQSNAVLMANHGLVAVGADLAAAFNVAEEIELVARIYYQTLVAGEAKILSKQQMDEVMEKFKGYGRP